MIFNTYWFALFAAVFFPGYWLLRKPAWRGWWLLGGCASFHVHFAGPAGVLPIVVLGTLTFVLGLTRRRVLCYAGIAVCVAALVFYKYTRLLSGGVIALLPSFNSAANTPIRWLPAAAPLAISFFTFEFVHYLFDVAHGTEPVRSPRKFALFAIYFPSLVAGPIKRYEQFTAALPAALAGVDLVAIANGAQRVALGFIKKVLIADNLSVALGFYEKDFALLSASGAWLFLAALSARILLDFSGYSDIAIGFSQMLGLKLPENFNFPYAASNLRDFWQRWHISLSSWIRDYVYIPLGGNRHGPTRRIFNLVLAFALCGLWHGAAGHFILWGLWHGGGLAIQAGYRPALGHFGTKIAALFGRVPALGWLITLAFVAFGWLLFFYPVNQAWPMAVKLLSFR